MAFTPHFSRSIARKSRAGSMRSSGVNGIMRTATRLTASCSIFASGADRRRGARSGAITDSGWLENVTTRGCSILSAASRRRCSSRCRWPRCTPSNIPTAAIVPLHSSDFFSGVSILRCDIGCQVFMRMRVRPSRRGSITFSSDGSAAMVSLNSAMPRVCGS